MNIKHRNWILCAVACCLAGMASGSKLSKSVPSGWDENFAQAKVDAEKDGKLILGLSGNPASASLALHLIGLPFLRALGGREKKPLARTRAQLLTPINKDSPYGRLVRGRMELANGEVCFRSMDQQGNGALTSLLGCDMIADIPPDTPPLPAGTVIEAYIL